MALRFFGPPSLALMDYHLARGWMPLREAVEVNCKSSQLLQVKMQVPGIWAKGCLFDDCVSLSPS